MKFIMVIFVGVVGGCWCGLLMRAMTRSNRGFLGKNVDGCRSVGGDQVHEFGF